MEPWLPGPVMHQPDPDWEDSSSDSFAKIGCPLKQIKEVLDLFIIIIRVRILMFGSKLFLYSRNGRLIQNTDLYILLRVDIRVCQKRWQSFFRVMCFLPSVEL